MMQRDVFVTAADLDDSRPPPDRQTFLSRFLRGKVLLQALSAIYLILAFSEIRLGDATYSLRSTLESLELLSATTPNFQEGYLMAAAASIPFALYVLAVSLRVQFQRGIPFFANVIFIRDIIQVLFLVLILGTGYGLVQNLQENFRAGETGLIINFNVLRRDYPVAITEGPDYNETFQWLDDVPIFKDTLQTYLREGTYVRALMTGLSNTLRAVALGLVFATLFGVFLGVALLSPNWLLRTVSGVYVEVFRNTPLLVQLFFVYSTLRLALPTAPADAYELPGPIFIGARGANYPKILTTDSFSYLLIFAVAGFLLGAYLWRWRLKVQDETGKPALTLRYFLAAFLGLSIVGFLLAWAIGPLPFDAETPRLGRFNFEDGASLTPEFLGLFLSLVLYTAAFIADIVRAGIQSVPPGQVEAAQAVGLSSGETLRLVVLPQAMRLIIPPLTNQYLNLSKNSSLAIGIGYYDLFNVSTIASNQSGQVVVFFVVMLLTYLALSLIIAAVMNMVNSSLQIQER